MIPTTLNFSKFTLVFLCSSMVVGCETEESKPDTSPRIDGGEEQVQRPTIDPFQPTINKLILGEEILLEQLVKELEHRTWEEIQPLILASIKQKSEEPNWTREAQKKALSGYSRVKLLFAKRLRKQTLGELRNAIQTALKEEQAKKRQ